MWCVLRALHPTPHHPERIANLKQYENELNFNGIEFPVSMAETTIRKFERQNPNILISISTWRESGLVPIRPPPRVKGKTLVHLLLISDNVNQHYCLIKEIERLYAKRTKNNRKQYICDWCLGHVTSDKAKHDIHIEDCLKVNKSPQKAVPAKEEDKVYYPYKIKKRMFVPYTIYADFESVLKKIKEKKGKGKSTRNMCHVHIHIPKSDMME